MSSEGESCLRLGGEGEEAGGGGVIAPLQHSRLQ